jgi:hypothetical protein
VIAGVSDSFGLLPSPAERVSFASSGSRRLDLYLVPEDPAELVHCEACQ